MKVRFNGIGSSINYVILVRGVVALKTIYYIDINLKKTTRGVVGSKVANLETT